MKARAAAAWLMAATLAGGGGCAREVEIPEDLGAARRGAGVAPQALMLRFREVKGEGSARESWELEVLQMVGDVRVRGTIRTGGVSVPLLDVMDPVQYMEFWTWLRDFPLDRAQLVEDADAAEEGWRKSLQVDVVLDEETRWRSRTSWTRPLVDAGWVDQIESRLHNMALVLAQREVQRQEQEAVAPPSSLDPADESPIGLPDAD